MIYLNLNFKNAGLIFDNEVHYSDIKIEEKTGINIIKNIFEKHRILKSKFGQSVTKKNLYDFKNGRAKALVFPNTIINIYKHRND
jgi:hypothetical protein